MTKDQETPKKMKSKSESTLNQPHIGVRFSVGLHPDAGLILGTIHILRNNFFLVIHSVSVYKKRWEIFTIELLCTGFLNSPPFFIKLLKISLVFLIDRCLKSYTEVQCFAFFSIIFKLK